MSIRITNQDPTRCGLRDLQLGHQLAGPRTVHDSFDWVPFTAAQLFTSDLPGLDRLVYSLGQGIAVGSHYSGMAGDLMGLPWMQSYLALIGVLNLPHDIGFVYTDATDILPRAQLCLTHNQPAFAHVFGDLLDRLEPNFRAELEKLAPKKTSDANFQADEDAFWEMYSRLDQECHATNLFLDGSVAPCVKCGSIGDTHAKSKDWKDLLFVSFELASFVL